MTDPTNTALLQSDATARQRGLNLDGSVRRETRDLSAPVWDDETRIAINTDADTRIGRLEGTLPFAVSKHLSTICAHLLGIYDASTDPLVREYAVAIRASAADFGEAALREHGAKPDAGWKPIASAPRDGTVILIAFGQDHVSSAAYDQDGGTPNPWKFIDSNGRWQPIFNSARDGKGGPSHWQPLPVPPALDSAPPAPPREDAKAGGSVGAASDDTGAASFRAWIDWASEKHFVARGCEDVAFRAGYEIARALSPSKVVHPLGVTGSGSIEAAIEKIQALPWVNDERTGGQELEAQAYDLRRILGVLQPPPRDSGQATGAEPDGAALADAGKPYAFQVVREGGLVGFQVHDITEADQKAGYESLALYPLATLRTSALPAQPSEATVRDALKRAGDIVYARSRDWPLAQEIRDLQVTVAPPRETELRPVEDSWRPIATAPKDGTPILAAFDNGCSWEQHVVWWTGGDYGWATGCGVSDAFPEDKLDVWQPLPAAPGEPRPVEQTGSGDAEIERLKAENIKLKSACAAARKSILRFPGSVHDHALAKIEKAFGDVSCFVDPDEAYITALIKLRDEDDRELISAKADLARVTAEITLLDGWSVINMPPADRASPDGNGVPHAIKLLTALKAEVDRNLAWANEVIIPRCERAEAEVARLTEAAAAGSDVAGLRAALIPLLSELNRLEREYGFDRPLHQLQTVMLSLSDIIAIRRAAFAASPDAGAGRTRGGMEGAR